MKIIIARRGSFAAIHEGRGRNCLLNSTSSLIYNALAWAWVKSHHSWNSCISRISPIPFILSSPWVKILQTDYSWAAKLRSERGRNTENCWVFFCSCEHLPFGSITTISVLRFLYHCLYFTSLYLKNNWKRNLLCLDGALLLLSGVKIWLHSDSDFLPRETGRRSPFKRAFKNYSAKTSIEDSQTTFPMGISLFTTFRMDRRKHAFKKNSSQANKCKQSLHPCFFLTSVFKETLKSRHMHFTVSHL